MIFFLPYIQLLKNLAGSSFGQNPRAFWAKWITQLFARILPCVWVVWFYLMFYDHLSAHSLLAKLVWLGWLMSTRLAWKKSQITSKWDLKHRECGQRTLSQFCHYWDCGLRESAGASCLKARSGGGGGGGGCKISWPGGTTTRSSILVPSRPKEVVKVFEPKLERILLP